MPAETTSLLTDARAAGRAVAAITTYTVESTRAICTAAEDTGLTVIIQTGSSSFRGAGREPLAAAALAADRAASVPVRVHLDHCTDLEQNIALTRRVVDRAHATGVWVEGELGALPGDQDASTDAAAMELTDSAQAAVLATRTGVDALAVAAGMVKVDINAELRRAYLGALAAARAEGDDVVPRIPDRAAAAMTQVAADKLMLLAGQRQPTQSSLREMS